IFFMVSSTFRENFGLEIDLPEAHSATEQQAAPHEIGVTKEGAYFLDQQQLGAEELREAIRTLSTEDDEAVLVIRADEGADWGAVLRAFDIARDEGGSRLVIPTSVLEDPASDP